jgi:hypothetical protein
MYYVRIKVKCIQDFGWETRSKQITRSERKPMILKRILKKQNGRSWINSDQDRNKFQAGLKTAMTVRVSKNAGDLYDS